MKIRYIFVLYFLFFNHLACSLTIEEESMITDKSLQLRVQKSNEQSKLKTQNSDFLKTNAFIVVCNPNWEGIYAFYESKLYISSGDKSTLKSDALQNAYFSKFIGYKQNGNVLSWKTSIDDNNLLPQGEKWEYHIDSMKMYRKTYWDKVYQDDCKLLK